MVGKSKGWQLTVTELASPVTSTCLLFHITDKHTGNCYLVDTRSEVSVLPPTPQDHQLPPHELNLTAVNNTPIPTFVTHLQTLNLGL